MNRTCLPGPLFALIVFVQASSAFGQFGDLVGHLPDDSNTLVLFNVEAILASPLAQKGKWREQNENMFAAGLLLVPPQATRFVMASQMDIELMEPHWHAAVMELSQEPSMLTATERYGGNVDEIEGRDAAVLPNNTYVIKFGKAIAGTMFPADRQKVTRWVQEVYSGSGRKPLGEYLTEAEGYADKAGTPIILAIELQHVISPKFIRGRLGSMKSLEGKTIDLDQLASVLASIRGITLGVTITDQVFGGLKVDFEQDVSVMRDVAKPLLLEILANHGAMIQEFNDWTVEVGGKEILLKGPLYPSGTQRICSVLDAPAALHPVEQPASTGDGQTAQSLVARSTQQYFKMIGQLVTDLRSDYHKDETITSGLIAMWYKKYASKIDALPILHVDPEMVQFGADVANALRQSQDAMQGVGTRSAMRITNKPDAAVYDVAAVSGARVGVGPRGGWGAQGGYAYRYAYDPKASLRLEGEQESKIRTQERIRGYGSANQIMQSVETAMANMRRTMTEKYNVEF